MGQPVATQTSGGVCYAFPDVCKTPTPGGPVPIPYPNTGDLGQAVNVSTTVKIGGKAVILQDSEIPVTTGDEAGVIGGVVSGVIKGKATFTSFSAKVRVEGKGVVRLGDATLQNDGNAAGTVMFGDPSVLGG